MTKLPWSTSAKRTSASSIRSGSRAGTVGGSSEFWGWLQWCTHLLYARGVPRIRVPVQGGVDAVAHHHRSPSPPSRADLPRQQTGARAFPKLRREVEGELLLGCVRVGYKRRVHCAAIAAASLQRRVFLVRTLFYGCRRITLRPPHPQGTLSTAPPCTQRRQRPGRRRQRSSQASGSSTRSSRAQADRGSCCRSAAP